MVKIVNGETYSSKSKAFDVGCFGRPYCVLFIQNPYTDLKDKEFFQPRENNAKTQWEYYVTLNGNPPKEFNWTKYLSDVKN